MIQAALNELRRDASKQPLPPLRFNTTSSQGPIQHLGGKTASEPDNIRSESSNGLDGAVTGEMIAGDDAPHQLSTNVGATPMTPLYEITRLRSLPPRILAQSAGNCPVRNPTSIDIISKGLLDRSEADRLVHIYLRRSDQYIYELAGKHHDLDSKRDASPVLLVAICAVAALQESSGGKTYLICKAELQSAGSVFNPKLGLEDLRGLCIATFWLYDISWALSGLAIRHACEVDLQGSFRIAVAAGPSASGQHSLSRREVDDAAEKIRLWYMLYVCDQHLSILHTRTPMLDITKPVKSCETFIPI